VTDPSGAIVPDVTVNLKNIEKVLRIPRRRIPRASTSSPCWSPQPITITISAPSFKKLTATTTVSVGANSIINAKLEVGAAGTTIEVSGEAPMLQTESAEISTTFNAREISEVPNPGNDLSFVAQTAAGSVMKHGQAATATSPALACRRPRTCSP